MGAVDGLEACTQCKCGTGAFLRLASPEVTVTSIVCAVAITFESERQTHVESSFRFVLRESTSYRYPDLPRVFGPAHPKARLLVKDAIVSPLRKAGRMFSSCLDTRLHAIADPPCSHWILPLRPLIVCWYWAASPIFHIR